MSATCTGNLTRTPELRFSQSGTAMCTFTVAENRKRGDEEQTSFFDVVAFGSLAENVAESLSRGQRVVVMGRLEQRRWETPEGDKRSKIEIVAEAVGPDLRWATCDVHANRRGT